MKENQSIEWKESWRDDYLRWICGFANAEGALVIGKNDRGRSGLGFALLVAVSSEKLW